MLVFDCKTDGHSSRLDVLEDRIIVRGERGALECMYSDMKSLHVKNADQFFLKIKLGGSSLVLEFRSMHVRDLVKSMVLSTMRSIESMDKSIMASNIEYRNLFGSLKSILTNSQFFKSMSKHEALFLQNGKAMSMESIPAAINQTLVDIFVAMNCSAEQFFNLLMSSYFYDIKNPRNSIDRLLADKLRGFNPDMDYATRINTFSLLSMASAGSGNVETKKSRSKQAEFEPLYFLEPIKVPYTNEYEFGMSSLSASLEVVDEEETQSLDLNSADFETARGLCKMVYKSRDTQLIEEAQKFTVGFRSMVERKYGKDALEYCERIFPTFYILE